MSRQTRTSFSAPRRFVRVLPVMAVLGLLLAGRVEAITQVSGSLPIGPDKGQMPPTDVLDPNEVVTIQVFFQNSSTSGVLSTPAAVNLVGTTKFFMSCSQPDCSTVPANQLAALTFNSCTGTTGVASCTVDGLNPNLVNITYVGAGGLPGKPIAATPKHCTGDAAVNCTVDADCAAATGVCVPGALLATIIAHAEPGQQVTTDIPPPTGFFIAIADTGTNNIHLASNDTVKGQTGGSAPMFFPPECPDGVVEPTGFCCSLPATSGSCDKRFPCGVNADCQLGLCCDASGNCNTAAPCAGNPDCAGVPGSDGGPTTCQLPAGTTCLLETCDDGNNTDTDNC